MNIMPIVPHVGIGPLKLGMTPDQILDAVNQIPAEWNLPDGGEVEVSRDLQGPQDETFIQRYMNNTFFFMVEYRDEKAVEIAVDYQLREYGFITLFETDVFKVPAEQLVVFLKQYSPCSYDLDDEQLSTNYESHDIGIRLWREEPFHLKLLSDEEYMKDMALVIDEMFHYLYFEIIGVR